MEKIKAQILPLDKPTINGHVYPRAVIEQALLKLKNVPLPVHVAEAFQTFGPDFVAKVSLGSATDLKIDDATNSVVANICVAHLPQQMENRVMFGAAGQGTLEDNVITDFLLTGVAVTLNMERPDPAAPTNAPAGT